MSFCEVDSIANVQQFPACRPDFGTQEQVSVVRDTGIEVDSQLVTLCEIRQHKHGLNCADAPAPRVH